YCGCNKIVTKDTSRSAPYLEILKQEILMKRALLQGDAPVEQLHLGGGTPTFLTDEQLTELMEFLRSQFRFSTAADADFSIEIDPRELRPNTLKLLRQLGFNRNSIGVQTSGRSVQESGNRIQRERRIRAVVLEARELGFRSSNMRLISGVASQSLETFDRALDAIVEMSPDRLS